MDARDTYVENHISTQQRARLIVVLYDGAIRFLKTARQKLEEGDYALKGVYIGKAQDVLAELSNCLNMEAGPQIANDLRALYNFLHRHLTQANIQRDPQMIDDCVAILEELRQAWEHVADTAEGGSDQAPPEEMDYRA